MSCGKERKDYVLREASTTYFVTSGLRYCLWDVDGEDVSIGPITCPAPRASFKDYCIDYTYPSTYVSHGGQGISRKAYLRKLHRV
jgi:hypothetical protein